MKNEMISEMKNEVGYNMNNETFDVVRRMLELSKTIIEAIDHFLERAKENDIEQCSVMLASVGNGMDSIVKTFPVIFDKDCVTPDISEECIARFDDAVRAMDSAVDAVIAGGMEDLKYWGQKVRTAFKDWDELVNKHLRKLSLM